MMHEVSSTASLETTATETWDSPEPQHAGPQSLATFDDRQWNKLRKQLKAQDSRVWRALASEGCPLLWALDGDWLGSRPQVDSDAPDTPELVLDGWRLFTSKKNDAAVSEFVEQWLEQFEATSVLSLLRSFTLAYQLPRLAHVLPKEWLRRVVEQLLTTGRFQVAGVEQSWLDQLTAVELPLVLAYQLPKVEACQEAAHAAELSLLRNMQAVVDAAGMPSTKSLAAFRPLLASWTRCVFLAEQRAAAAPAGDQSSRDLFAAAVEQAIRLLRRDGTQVFGPAEAEAEDVAWLKVAARVAKRSDLRDALRVTLGELKADSKKLFPCSAHSETSQLSVLRINWNANAARLVVSTAQRRLKVEFDAGRELVVAGDWTPEVTHNGNVLQPISDWSESCWISNAHADYLELQIDFDHGVKLERQIALARHSRFLFVADVLLAQSPAALAVRSPWSLVPGVDFAAEQETREGSLVQKKPIARALPIAFPEWRIQPVDGGLETSDDGFALTQRAANVSALYSPFVLDFDRKRHSQPFTWRRLTVGDDHVAVTPDVAVGCRFQLGSEQWLVYRSLQAPAPRTLLGHHLISQFMLGRVTKKGMVKTLVEIE